MGGLYGNITLKGVSQTEVAEALRGRRAIVAPAVGDYVVAFDSVCDDQDTDAMHALTSRLSSVRNCSITPRSARGLSGGWRDLGLRCGEGGSVPG